MRVLLLEDDSVTARAVAMGLSRQGYEVLHAPSVDAARADIDRLAFDAAVLDLMVPGGDGYDVLSYLRDQSPGVPILILTARDSIGERVDGLDRGADDYLVKPFAVVELAARLRALLRRPQSRIEVVRCGSIQVDPLHRTARCGESTLNLTPKEFDLVHCLASRPGEILNRKLLLELVWGYRFDPGTNVIEVHLNKLRRKLDLAGAEGVIRTIRGVGYSMRA